MLSNYIVGNQKFVLFIDEVGLEKRSNNIIEQLLKEQNVVYEKQDIHNVELSRKINSKTAIIIEPISKLELEYEESSLMLLLQELKLNKNISQLFAWVTTKNIRSQILIPFLEYLSDSTVYVTSESYLSILTKRQFANALSKVYQHDLLKGKTAIHEKKISRINPAEVEEFEENQKLSETFKIGDFTAHELEAKKNLKLPFELINLPAQNKSKDDNKGDGKIVYTPDDLDDFDEEEDPDDDLIM
ncbi:CLUMA_CG020301, isoform A [Clunio marinus]|uniref:Elongator complex protein 5 n=1 Tax=Clunio marinus TaxID=568069 RepID=A0A1J1J5Q4_9DIPT|nr:CLUMA_CG020301, isoform A [Clunio marinus]